MASSSSPPTKPYEVFISFRGEDTRNNFVSHLYSALKDRGIRTYFDEDNLQKGQTISTELVKAIQESSIATVVLSTNYASSTWCLDELANIIECKHEYGLLVFPIFYHVDPSDIRKQKNSFGEALSKHQENLKDGCKKVKIWRDALTKVANLAGVDITGEENEAKCIKEIVDQIFSQLPVNAFPSTKSLIGLESRISEIKKLMYSKPNENEVVFIGLWGMGGIGKTTAAKALLRDCKNKFEGSCFLKDVRQSKNEMEKLQKKLLSEVLKISVDISDVDQGSSMIKERLSSKKVLLVIDDVDDIDQVNALAKEPNWFGSGSRIIITTRDEGFLNDDHIVKYDVKTLTEGDALHLFCLHAFKDNHPTDDYRELSYEVVSYASGLPLALEVLGNHFKRGKNKSFWNEALKRLKNLPDRKITSRLQISYDGLLSNEKHIFLNIACFFKSYPCPGVKRRLESLGLFPEEGVHVLVQKSLIHIDIDDCIEMHDLLQEMGLNIVQQEANRDVKRYSRLWLKNDIVDVLSGIKINSEVEWIFWNYDDYNKTYDFHDASDEDDFLEDYDTNYVDDNDSSSSNDDDHGWNKNSGGDGDINLKLIWEGGLTKMNELRFLEFCGDILEGNHVINVTQSCGDVEPCPSLRWFSWHEFPGQSLPKSFHPWHLVHLSMINSKIEETPDFSHMPNLEVLNLCGSTKLVKVHPSLGDHTKINRINLSHCSKIKKFPKINQMESLEVLNLSYTRLRSFPEIYGNLNSLRKLRIRQYISSSKELRINPAIQVVLECSPRLVSLEIIRSCIVQTPDFCHLPNLEMLDLSGSRQLVEVHASLGYHKRIKSIKLEACSKLEEFPRICDMDSLIELNLSETCLQSFPEITGNVNRLVKLKLGYPKITMLPRWIERATKLETISVRGCKHLRTLDIPLSSSLVIHSGRCRSFLDLIVSQGSEQFSGPRIYISVDESLEELPEIILSRVVFLHMKVQGSMYQNLIRWVCSNLVDLLHKYQHLCKLQLHRYRETSELSQTFSDMESMTNMLRKRENYFEVEVHIPEYRIPFGFQYRICGSSVNVFIKSIDKLKGICICGLDAKLTDQYVPSAARSSASIGDCDCIINDRDRNVVVMYIPIDTIKGDRSDWDGEKECTLLELKSNLHWLPESRTDPIWGLSLVYNEGEGEVVIMDDCLDWSNGCTMKLKIAKSRGMREAVELDLDDHEGNSNSNNLIPQPLLKQQLFCVWNEDRSMVYGLGVPFYNFVELMKNPDAPVAESYRDNLNNLDSLYCLPFALTSHGSFEEAEDSAKRQNKWLLLNLRSTEEFRSYRLNRDTWANEHVAQIIKNNFIFWQVNDDTEEGRKLCTDYRIDAAPIILVIDPLTSQEISSWHGMVQPESLLEDLMSYIDRSPADHPIIPAHKRRRVTENTEAPPQPWNDESNYELALRLL